MFQILSNIFPMATKATTPVEETQDVNLVPVVYDFTPLREFASASPLYSQVETHILEIERLLNIK